VHPSGRPYRTLRGSVGTIATITPEERTELHTLARSLDAMPKLSTREPRTASPSEGMPGADYNARGDVLALLENHGWNIVYTRRDGVVCLRRPGKECGTSATFGIGGTRYLYVFSTSTEFESERAYSPFAVYAKLEHDDDFSAAAQTLAALGYGTPAARLITPGRDQERDAASATDWRWPTLDDAALYGLAGDVVRAIEPHTEGDPVAVLADFHVMFGSAVGRSPFAAVGATRHSTNEYAVLVGKTARARKGTAHDEAIRLCALADPHWSERVVGGLSSGEGVIHAVRDATYKIDRKTGDEVIDDPGVGDKRLLAVEPEYSSVLRVASRDGNTLSEVLRRGFDGINQQILTKNAPIKATAPHISLLGHITEEELRRELTETQQANGFANRHLFFCVMRSKLLPHGGKLEESQINDLVQRIRIALAEARRCGEIRRDLDANKMWEAVYPALTAERPGLFGAITARAEAHALRLSLNYALLDGADAIRPPHLEAALALWQYAEDSARFIFCDAIGDPVADRVLSALRTHRSMAQNEIVDLFGRHVSASRLSAALETLVQAGKVRSNREDTGGRPRTTWEVTP
jgi:hypothetical protein